MAIKYRPNSKEERKAILEILALPREERLKRLLDSGGCSQEFFDAEMAKEKED